MPELTDSEWKILERCAEGHHVRLVNIAVVVEQLRGVPYYGVMSEDWLRGFCEGVVAMRDSKGEA
jgi:hypothetical protein